jgi:hypothetical protein
MMISSGGMLARAVAANGPIEESPRLMHEHPRAAAVTPAAAFLERRTRFVALNL